MTRDRYIRQRSDFPRRQRAVANAQRGTKGQPRCIADQRWAGAAPIA